MRSPFPPFRCHSSSVSPSLSSCVSSGTLLSPPFPSPSPASPHHLTPFRFHPLHPTSILISLFLQQPPPFPSILPYSSEMVAVSLQYIDWIYLYIHYTVYGSITLLGRAATNTQTCICNKSYCHCPSQHILILITSCFTSTGQGRNWSGLI